MKTLLPTDYVIYDEANDHVLQWEKNGGIIIFGDKQEALENCYGNEKVIPCTELPAHHQNALLKEINQEEVS